jgi:multidrug resistance efflux pump
MLQKRPPKAALIAIGIVLLLTVVYYGIRALNGDENGKLQASGTIEAVMVDISPELPGQVRQVLVEEGDQVAADAPLLVLDDSLILQQRAAAQAALESAMAASASAQNSMDIAKAKYQQTLEAALTTGRNSRLSDWFARDQAQFDQPEWYFSRAEQIHAVQAQIDDAKQDWQASEAKLHDVFEALDKTEFLAAEQRMLAARVSYLVRKDVNEKAQNSTDADAPVGRYNRTHCGTNEGYILADRSLTNLIYRCTGDEHLSQVSQRLFDEAKAELDESQKAYNALLTTQAADEILAARAEVAVAQERYYAALDRMSALQTSDYDPTVTAAQGAVDQALAAYDQSKKIVAQAQAGVDLIDAQIQKYTLRAPMDGVILTRSVEPGEFLQPGALAMSLGDLNQLTITVYVPEDRYGQIHRGQMAIVEVDSFPGVTFEAQVTNISDHAEFTPRNIQTVEGRSATVYAVKLTVIDAEGRLKPGMPADVDFSE